ncbi:hypothetical protein [Streptomyces yangpuensis]
MKYTDKATAQRMAALVQNSGAQLAEVNHAFRIAMRRLSRTPNIILRGGAT